MYIDFSNLNYGPNKPDQQPKLMLQTLSETNLGYLRGVYDLHFDIGFSELSEISFNIPKMFDGIANPLYDSVVGYKVVKTKDLGVYVLTNPSISGDGLTEEKSVHGYSIEKTFERKSFFLAEGIYRFYDPEPNPDVQNRTKSIIELFMELNPTWKVGTVSSTLWNQYRMFDQYKENALTFLYGDLIDKYKCFVVCHPYKDSDGKRRIDFLDANDAKNPLVTKPVYLSYANLVENTKVTEETDHLVTQLSPYGSESLSIRDVNPIGADYLVNLDHFIENGDIDKTTADRVRDWETLINSKKEVYSGIVSLRASATAAKIAAEAEKTDLNHDLQDLMNQQNVKMQEIYIETNPAKKAILENDLMLLTFETNAKQKEIDAKAGQIASLSATILEYTNKLLEILDGDGTNPGTRYTAFFSDDERKILDQYLIQGDITDETFVATNIDKDTSGSVNPFVGEIKIVGGEIEKTEVSFTDRTKIIYTIKGGKLTSSNQHLQPLNIVSADIIRGTMEVNNKNNDYVCSLSCANCLVNNKEKPGGMITLIGVKGSVAVDNYLSIMEEVKNAGIDLSKTKYGNIDTNNRQVLIWTDENLLKYKTQLSSWGMKADEYRGTISTVIGMSSEFDGVEIAYSPLLQSDPGPILLSREVVVSYISKLVKELSVSGASWNTEDLLKLDKEGSTIDEILVKELIADAGATAIKTGQAMHYTGTDGAVALASREVDAEAEMAHMKPEEYITKFAGASTGEDLSFLASDSIIYITTTITDYQKYSVAKDLYDFGVAELAELSRPTYEFDADTANFFFQDEFKPFKNSFSLGDGIHLMIGSFDGYSRIEPRVIGVSLDFEDITALSLTFSNKFQRIDGQKVLREVIEKSYSSSRSFDASRYLYNQTGVQAPAVSNFMNSALDAANNAIVNSGTQSVTIDGAGIRIGGEDQYQMRLVNKMLAITDDGWQSTKLAIGHFKHAEAGGGVTNYFGVNADVIAGKLIVGNNLVIECEQIDPITTKPNGVIQFKVDQTGAWLNNAQFVLQKTGAGKILIDPKYGIVAGGQGLFDVDGTTIDYKFLKPGTNIPDLDADGIPKNANFYLDATDGKAYFRGNVVASGGNIGGWKLGDTEATENRLYSGQKSNYVALNTSMVNDPLYAIWAGDEVPKKAKFSVMRDGTVKVKGNVDADSFSINGKNALNGNSTQIAGGYIDGKGISVSNKAGVPTFVVSPDGDVTVSGTITMGAGSTISWGPDGIDPPPLPDDVVTTTDAEKITDFTQLSDKYIASTEVRAEKLVVNAAKVEGKLDVATISADNLVSGEIDATLIKLRGWFDVTTPKLDQFGNIEVDVNDNTIYESVGHIGYRTGDSGTAGLGIIGQIPGALQSSEVFITTGGARLRTHWNSIYTSNSSCAMKFGGVKEDYDTIVYSSSDSVGMQVQDGTRKILQSGVTCKRSETFIHQGSQFTIPTVRINVGEDGKFFRISSKGITFHDASGRQLSHVQIIDG